MNDCLQKEKWSNLNVTEWTSGDEREYTKAKSSRGIISASKTTLYNSYKVTISVNQY